MAKKQEFPVPQPAGNNIIMEPLGTKETLGGILLPESDSDPVLRGIVAAVGPGSFDNNGNRLGSDAVVGETWLYRKGHRYAAFDHGGKKYVCVPENDLVARV